MVPTMIQFANVKKTAHILILAEAAKVPPAVCPAHADDTSVFLHQSLSELTWPVNAGQVNIHTVRRRGEFVFPGREREREEVFG